MRVTQDQRQAEPGGELKNSVAETVNMPEGQSCLRLKGILAGIPIGPIGSGHFKQNGSGIPLFLATNRRSVDPTRGFSANIVPTGIHMKSVYPGSKKEGPRSAGAFWHHVGMKPGLSSSRSPSAAGSAAPAADRSRADARHSDPAGCDPSGAWPSAPHCGGLRRGAPRLCCR